MSRKAVTKRIHITSTGKLLRRHSRQNHFNAKVSRKSQLNQKGFHHLHPTVEKKLRAYL